MSESLLREPAREIIGPEWREGVGSLDSKFVVLRGGDREALDALRAIGGLIEFVRAVDRGEPVAERLLAAAGVCAGAIAGQP